MKPITVHPGSALAGAGVLALVLLGTGIAAPQGIAQAATTQRMFIENVQDIDSYPNPRDYVVIRGGDAVRRACGQNFGSHGDWLQLMEQRFNDSPDR